MCVYARCDYSMYVLSGFRILHETLGGWCKREMKLCVRKGLVGGCMRYLGTWSGIRLYMCVCILRLVRDRMMDTLSWAASWWWIYVRRESWVGECTRYLGLGVPEDFGWLDAYVRWNYCTRNPDTDIGLNERAIWVRMSQDTLGGCM